MKTMNKAFWKNLALRVMTSGLNANRLSVLNLLIEEAISRGDSASYLTSREISSKLGLSTSCIASTRKALRSKGLIESPLTEIYDVSCWNGGMTCTLYRTEILLFPKKTPGSALPISFFYPDEDFESWGFSKGDVFFPLKPGHRLR